MSIRITNLLMGRSFVTEKGGITGINSFCLRPVFHRYGWGRSLSIISKLNLS